LIHPLAKWLRDFFNPERESALESYMPFNLALISLADGLLIAKNQTTASCSNGHEDAQTGYFECALPKKRIGIFDTIFWMINTENRSMSVCCTKRILPAVLTH
jgi:hypothetical protein